MSEDYKKKYAHELYDRLQSIIKLIALSPEYGTLEKLIVESGFVERAITALEKAEGKHDTNGI